MNYEYKIKIIIIGDSNVGKSNIITKFIDDEFNQDISTTIGVDYKSAIVDHLDKSIKLIIWDTAGQERFKSITKSFYNGASVFILCFDLTNAYSFDSIDIWYKEIKEMFDSNLSNPIVILVGNKSDLEKCRVVSKEDGVKKAMCLKLQGYFETSAKTSQGLNDLFLNIIKIYMKVDNIKLIKKNKLANNININIANKPKKNFISSCFIC